MSKTWREIPKGPPKDPRPPEKGGHKNIYKETIEEIEEVEEEDGDWFGGEFEDEEN